MANELQTSFIPKQNFTKTVTVAASQASVGLLLLVSLIIFGSSLVLFAGAYGYQYMLSSQINNPCEAGSDAGCGLRASLERDKRELQVDRIIGFSRLDAKMKTSSAIIGDHQTLLSFFDLLQKETIETIRYTRLDYAEGSILIEGLARGYEDVAVQAKALNESDLVTKSTFSDLGLDKSGNVIFKLALSVKSDVFNYEKSLKSDDFNPQASQAEQELFPNTGAENIEDLTGVPLPTAGDESFPNPDNNTQ